jgi:hypothetical protein
VRFQGLTEVSLKMRALWDIAPCSLVEVERYLMMEAVCTSETSVYFNKTTGRFVPKDYFLLQMQSVVTGVYNLF